MLHRVDLFSARLIYINEEKKMKDESDENTRKNQRLQETSEEDFGYPLYPERKNPELYKEYSALGRRCVKVIEKRVVKCFTHCKFSRISSKVVFTTHL